MKTLVCDALFLRRTEPGQPSCYNEMVPGWGSASALQEAQCVPRRAKASRSRIDGLPNPSLTVPPSRRRVGDVCDRAAVPLRDLLLRVLRRAPAGCMLGQEDTAGAAPALPRAV